MKKGRMREEARGGGGRTEGTQGGREEKYAAGPANSRISNHEIYLPHLEANATCIRSPERR
eukprot:5558976-Pyramimonas_sp.AAC.1